MNQDDKKSVLAEIQSFSESARKEAIEINNLPNGALASFLTGTIALGFVFGGVWWLPFAFSVGPAILRISRFLIFSNEEKKYHRLKLKRENIRENILLHEEINSSSLPIEIKQQEHLNILENVKTNVPFIELSSSGILKHNKKINKDT